MPATANTPVQAEDALNSALQQYGRLWPLHSFNACNPLVGLENLPFHDALTESRSQSGFETKSTYSIFKNLYDKGAFSINDVNHVIENTPFTGKNLDSSSPHSYKGLCHNELLAILHNNDPVDMGFNKHQQESLYNALNGNTKECTNYLEVEKHQWINEQTTKYLAAYLDDGQALWSMPDKNRQSLLKCWIQCLRYDRDIEKEQYKAIEKWFKENKRHPTSTILTHASDLIHQNAELYSLFNEHLKQLPGWVGYLKYYSEEHSQHEDLVHQYLIIRLLYHWQVSQTSIQRKLIPTIHTDMERLWALYSTQYQKKYTANAFINEIKEHSEHWRNYLETVTPVSLTVLLMEALEQAQQQSLLYNLNQAYQNETREPNKHAADAQVVFCIDVRSEPYRKALESSGNIETYGFAGFFGLPIARQGLTDNESTALCPILLKPQYTIPEAPLPTASLNWLGKKQQDYQFWKEQWIYSLKKIKRDTFGTFGYVEGLGAIHGITTFMDTFIAGYFSKILSKINRGLLNPEVVKPRITHLAAENSPSSHQCEHKTIGIPAAEQVELASTVLTLMGIQQPYSQFIVICGHTGHAKNNPYASALDCGACGANGGGYNARVLCDILNQPKVRQGLSNKGIDLPAQTLFIAAEHSTTTNKVEFLNEHAVPQDQYTSFLVLKEYFKEASERTSENQERKLAKSTSLYNKNELQSMAWDWSQTRPEWGLSRNQAFIIGQRNHFKDIDLEGRSFLHSYNWETDFDDSILTMIMTAPMVVGTWISCQYLFSTLDQSRFGSGTKYTHNVVGLFGIYQGNQSDLQIGLPYESLFQNDGTPYHYPQRLLVCIEAPVEKVDRIVKNNPQVHQLVNNEWIKLVIFDPKTKKTITYNKTSQILAV